MSKCGKCAPSKAGIEPDDQTLCDSCNAREQQLRKLRSSSRSDIVVTAAAAAEQGPLLLTWFNFNLSMDK